MNDRLIRFRQDKARETLADARMLLRVQQTPWRQSRRPSAKEQSALSRCATGIGACREKALKA